MNNDLTFDQFLEQNPKLDRNKGEYLDARYEQTKFVVNGYFIAYSLKALATYSAAKGNEIYNYYRTPNIAIAAEESTLAANSTRVGRWMSKNEYSKMVDTGYVQESNSGQTYVANPATPDAYVKQAKPGTVYVEFDVPTNSLKQTKDVWAKILGSNTPEARLMNMKGLPIPEIPEAQNIELIMEK